MIRKWIAMVLAVVLALSLTACSKEPETVVYVENVGQILGIGTIGMRDNFPGIVISEDKTEIQRDDYKTVSKLYVKAGQEVNSGDLLFEYDVEALSLNLAKQKLDLERLNNSIATLKTQIAQLQKEQKAAGKDEQLSYTVEIQERQAQMKEAEYNVKLKQKDIEQTEDGLRNSEVYSPITGRVVSVDEQDTGEYGAYIIIQKSGSYRVKASINELNMGAVVVGDTMRVTSRANADQFWLGTVSSIDLESPDQGGDDYFYGDPMTNSSSYSFYVEMQQTEGLMLGQHVYLELGGNEAAEAEGLWLPEYYVCYNAEGATFVWAEDTEGRLEMRPITLGGYNDMEFTYEILEGLTVADHIAFPGEYCRIGAETTRDMSQEVFPTDGEEYEEYDPENGDGSGEDWGDDNWGDTDWVGSDSSGYSPDDPWEGGAELKPNGGGSGGSSSDGNMGFIGQWGGSGPSSSGNLGG